jgi:drug/metabolite transporter (DMT)-like permease
LWDVKYGQRTSENQRRYAGIFVKSAAGVGPLKIAFFRFVVGLVLVVAASWWGRFRLEFNDKRLLFVRGVCGGTAVYIAFLAISKLGLGKGTLLICCYPIFACLFSAMFLKERFGVYSMFAIMVALTGIYFVSRDNGGSFSLLSAFGKYEIITLVGAMMGGIAVVTIRKLHDTDNSWSIYFSQCLGGLVLFGVPALASTWDISLSEWLFISGVGVCSTIGQLLMTQGFRYVPVRIGSLFGMLDPVLAYAAGVVIFGEGISVFAVFGGMLVIGACCMVIRGRRQ